jgi:hypothetical protein
MSLVKKHGKVFGYYDGPQPNLWITDLELIKAIFVKDFDHFVDRRVNFFITVWIISYCCPTAVKEKFYFFFQSF